MLHLEGIEIIPMTLTVGDYILTLKRVLSAKASQILLSLNSGRFISKLNKCVDILNSLCC